MSLHLPQEAEVVERIEESSNMVTLRLRLTDPAAGAAYRFEAGQFNMLYLYGVGEVPITMSSDPDEPEVIAHTIRAVGRVSRGLVALPVGARLGLRGPYGRGWPLQAVEGRDVVFATGGLGCAPVVGAINYIARRRGRYGRLNILQGVKHTQDLIWKGRYDVWRALPDTQVLLAADVGAPVWPWHIGLVTDLLGQLQFDPPRTTVMMCGPEGMMQAVCRQMLHQGVADTDLWLSTERNMQCAVGHCGHCQYGPQFVCRQGPVFTYRELQPFFGVRGF